MSSSINPANLSYDNRVPYDGRISFARIAWRTGSLAGEISAQIMERAFDELDAPVMRVCNPHQERAPWSSKPCALLSRPMSVSIRLRP